jgi:hypothetical protein
MHNKHNFINLFSIKQLKKGTEMAPRIALIGNSVVLISFMLIALKFPVWGLSFALIGNMIFFFYGIRTGQKSFCYVSVLLAASSLYGIYNWLK